MKNTLRRLPNAFTLTMILCALLAGNLRASAQSADLLISEYLEGTGFNKAIEIYNPTGAVIDFTGYAVAVYTNGNATPNITFNLTGQLASDDVYVIANSQADPLILAVTDTTSGVCNFNGNDAVALLKNGNPIDIIGQIGFNPGTNWTLPGGGATSDFTLIRNSNISIPETVWNISQNQWSGQPLNTFTFLGTHTGPVGVSEPTDLMTFALLPNPATSAFSVRLNINSNPVMIEIYDLIGNRLLAEPVTGRSQIDFRRPLNPGIYMITVLFESGKRQTKRLVIQTN